MKRTNFLPSLHKVHERKWIALSRDHKNIIACNASLTELDKQVTGQDVVYMKIGSFKTYFTSKFF